MLLQHFIDLHIPHAHVYAATTASAVLNCDGALPKLLDLLTHTSDIEKLNSSLLTATAQVTLTRVPSLDEIKEVIDKVSSLNSIKYTLLSSGWGGPG